MMQFNKIIRRLGGRLRSAGAGTPKRSGVRTLPNIRFVGED